MAKELDSTYSSRGIDIYYAADGYTKARKEIEDYIENQNIVPGGHGGLWDVSETMAISKKLVRTNLFAVGDTTQKGNGHLMTKEYPETPQRQMKNWVNNSLISGLNSMLRKSGATYPILKKISKYQGILRTTLPMLQR